MSSVFSQWHEQPRLVALVASIPGKAMLWLVSVPLILWLGGNLLVAVALAAVTTMPSRKRLLLSIAALGVVLDGLLRRHDAGLDMQFLLDGLPPGVALSGLLIKASVVVGMLYIAYRICREYNRWPAFARRSPVLFLHAGLWLAMILSVLPPLAVLLQVSFLAWRLSYMVKYASRGLIAESRFSDHLMYLMPAWGGTSAPFGKGLDYLSRHEANDGESLARSQLAGFKLLLLASAWTVARDLLDAFAFGQPVERVGTIGLSWSMDLPRLAAAIAGDSASLGWIQTWSVLALELVRDVLSIAITGHLVVACLRLFGFNVFRNTYKPLLAESVVDYWGRYYYYFKELLVDFFFYPTYLRMNQVNPRLRIFLAVFAAAFAGNVYYHVLYMPAPVVQGDFQLVWDTWGTRLIYCALLALGIWVSMLRQQHNRGKSRSKDFFSRLRRMAGVWLFFGVIQVWNQKSVESGTVDAFRFFFRLLGF